MAHDDQRNDRGLAGSRREYDDGRAHPRRFAGDVYGDEPGRDRRWSQDDREGFWGRGHRGTGFERDEHRDYSREDYGATDRGAGEHGGGHGGGFSSTGEEGRGGQGYGWQRDFGRETSGRSFSGNRGRGFGDDDRGRTDYGNREGSERGFIERATDEVSAWFGDRDAERRREQDYRGRGPKGFKRSDQRIQEDVNDRLADDPYLDASDVEVTVSAAEVTLAGSVDSRQARRRAEDLAERVSGVSYVQNNIRFRANGGGNTPGSGSMAGEDKTA